MYQFYSMKLYKTEILKYIHSGDDANFKKFIIQFFAEDSKTGVDYKMRGWVLHKDDSSYPVGGNLLAEGEPIDAGIKAPMYFTNCELSKGQFKRDILDKVGGLGGNWDLITLKPLQEAYGYLLVELSIDVVSLGTVKVIANPCPPNQPRP